ncbi:MAG: metal-dependent hydrolase [Planctomycetaceae bacterium]|nr:metal-dependent hydrolase [Planctomycetaceae bacterium]
MANQTATLEMTFLGHSAFQIRHRGQTLLIDPFLTGNPVAAVREEELNPDVILLTHGHADHVGDTVALAKRTGALVVANFEIVNWLSEQGVKNAHPMHLGGQHAFEFGVVKLTIAHHGSSLPDGSYGGNPAGIVLTLGDHKVYHAGDTALFSDMALIGEMGIDVAILPIGDNFTMGPDDAVRAVQFLQPKYVIPCHYQTWDLIHQDANAFAETVREQTEAEPVVLEPGENFVL